MHLGKDTAPKATDVAAIITSHFSGPKCAQVKVDVILSSVVSYLCHWPKETNFVVNKTGHLVEGEEEEERHPTFFMNKIAKLIQIE